MIVINFYWLSPQEPEKKMKQEQDDLKRKEEEEKNKEQDTGANEDDDDDEDDDDEEENEPKEEPEEEDEDEEETVPKDELWGGVIRDPFFCLVFQGFCGCCASFPWDLDTTLLGGREKKCSKGW